MTNTSVTLAETGIADAVNDGGPYESALNRMFALDFATQAQEMKAIGGQPDYALGSVHAITAGGTLVIASASVSQLASYAWGAANVIFVAGAQKLVPTLEAAHQRIYTHSLPLEDARAQAAYAQHSQVGKILEIHQELPGRIHIVLIPQRPGGRGRGRRAAGPVLGYARAAVPPAKGARRRRPARVRRPARPGRRGLRPRPGQHRGSRPDPPRRR